MAKLLPSTETRIQKILIFLTIEMVKNERGRQTCVTVEEETENIASAIDLIAMFFKGGRLFYFGAGTSGSSVYLMLPNVRRHSAFL
ncbi:MAG: hypothetical protein ACLSA2_05625 [Candidatus Gastranaerophilaceae bacterium]